MAKDEDVLTALNYFVKLNKTPHGLLKSDIVDPREKGIALAGNFGSWAINTLTEKYPDLKYGVQWVVAPPPTPRAGMTPKYFADTKGISIYASARKEEQLAVMKFIQFVFSDVQQDLNWVTTTALLPARDDLSSNPVFAEYFDTHNPAFKEYATAIKDGVPAMDNKAGVEVQETMSNVGWIPMLDDKNPIPAKQAWTNIKEEVAKVLNEK